MTVYIVVCEDRHIDDCISVHATRDGADVALTAFMDAYEGVKWTERSYGAPKWCRYVDSHDDGPRARIEVAEMDGTWSARADINKLVAWIDDICEGCEVADVLGVSGAAKFEQLKKSWGIK